MSRAGVPSDHAERCLGHVIGGVRGVYDRHEYHAEKASAFEALADRYNHRSSFSAWILWAGPRWSARYVAAGYDRLDAALVRGEDAAEALAFLARANVKYLVIHEPIDGLRRLLDTNLVAPTYRLGTLLVLRNRAWLGDELVRLRPDERSATAVALPYQRPEPETIRIALPHAGRVVVAEAYHPHWRARLDGVAVAVTPSTNGLIAIDAPGARPHELVLEFRAPRSYRLLPLASLVALVAASVLALLLRRPRLRK